MLPLSMFTQGHQARVDSDYKIWPLCIGYKGEGKMNDNGQSLLHYQHLLPRQSLLKGFVETHQIWHQPDLIFTCRKHLQDLLQTCRFHSEDFDTDHVCCKIRLSLWKFHCTKQSCSPCVNINNTKDQGTCLQFIMNLREAMSLNADTTSNTLRMNIHFFYLRFWWKDYTR